MTYFESFPSITNKQLTILVNFSLMYAKYSQFTDEWI